MATSRPDESKWAIFLYSRSISIDETTETAGRPDHQQRVNFCARPAPEFCALYGDETCRHRPYPIDITRRAEVQNCLWPDRHWKRGDRNGDENGRRRISGGWIDPSGTSDGSLHRGGRGSLHGRS